MALSFETQITEYISSQPEGKREEMQKLHTLALSALPGCKLWFFDGKNDDGKVVSNPTIGYGSRTINYAKGDSREFFQIGLSANKTGISVYVMGIEDKKYLPQTYGEAIGKAKVTGYCIRFRGLKDIDLDVLERAMKEVLKTTKATA